MTSKTLIFLAFLILIVGVVAADAPPPIPCEYHGTLTIGGVPAPVGTIVQTRIYGTVRGEEVTTQAGQYEYLIGQITSSEATCGCTITVEFWVNGYKADQTSTFTSGDSKKVDLTVSGVAPPTTSPTTSPTTIPPTTIPPTRPTSIPAIPHAFYGTVVIYDSVPAPAGSVVEGRAAGVLNDDRNPLTTTVEGEYGTPGDDLVVQGYLENGTPIAFYVGGVRADCYDVAAGTGWATSYPFSPGGHTELNLRTNISAPVADFSAYPAAGYEPLTVQFTDLSQGPATTWLWEFGDGKTSNEQNPVHKYNNGNYDVTLTVTNLAGNDTLSRQKFITVYRQSSPGGGGGGGGGGGYYAVSTGTPTGTPTVTPTPTPTVTTGPGLPGGNLPLNSDLALSQSVTIASQDNTGIITMLAGVRPTTSLGEPLLTLSIRRIPDSEVPAVPAGALFAYAGYAYEIEPSGAAFDPYITLTVMVSQEDWAGLQGRQLFLKWYNPATSAWEDLPATTDAAAHTVSAKITHTSVFALFAESVPTTAPTTVPTSPPPSPWLGGFLWIVLIVIIVAVVIMVIFIIMMRRREQEEELPEEEWKIE